MHARGGVVLAPLHARAVQRAGRGRQRLALRVDWRQRDAGACERDSVCEGAGDLHADIRSQRLKAGAGAAQAQIQRRAGAARAGHGDRSDRFEHADRAGLRDLRRVVCQEAHEPLAAGELWGAVRRRERREAAAGQGERSRRGQVLKRATRRCALGDGLGVLATGFACRTQAAIAGQLIDGRGNERVVEQ